MKLVSLFGDHIVSAVPLMGADIVDHLSVRMRRRLAMEAGAHATAQTLEQAAVARAIEAVHLEAANLFETR